MAIKNAVKADGEEINVDPLLLFQRLSSVAKNLDLESALKSELSNYPLSLFEFCGVLLEPQKSTFADSIWKIVQCQ